MTAIMEWRPRPFFFNYIVKVPIFINIFYWVSFWINYFCNRNLLKNIYKKAFIQKSEVDEIVGEYLCGRYKSFNYAVIAKSFYA